MNIVVKMKKYDDKDCCSIDLDTLKELDKTIDKMRDKKELYRIVEINKALSDPTRLQILYLLRNTDLCVCELMSLMKKPQSTLSHHLSILKAAQIIKSRKKGVWVYYTFINPEIREFLDNILFEKIYQENTL